jgi:hypothetical protein
MHILIYEITAGAVDLKKPYWYTSTVGLDSEKVSAIYITITDTYIIIILVDL